MIQKPKGTRDILPQETQKWKEVEECIQDIFHNYGFGEIRVPVFESTELFQRGVGETTDVVQKEMYTFEDKAGRSMTLRPEGTASVIRAYLENGMASMPSPLKLYYNMAMYRYENVQKGRYREFRQIGAEIIGTSSYLADVELISMANHIFEILNIPDVQLELNSIGCPVCRKEYQQVLKRFLEPNLTSFCQTCQTRFEKNPMRILDCKEESCQALLQGAPVILDYLCPECKEHFKQVTEKLTYLGIQYQINPSIVRGLDYYSKTVFEFVAGKEGYTVLGGGRYDGLVSQLGGPETPAIGFAMGMDRFMQLYTKIQEDKKKDSPQLYVAYIGEPANLYTTELVEKLRKQGIYVEKDIMEKSLKAQLKYANKKQAKYSITIGDTEIEEKRVKVKEMLTGEEKEIELTIPAIIEAITNKL